jgi:capsular polysaccharide biosynthesis protein
VCDVLPRLEALDGKVLHERTLIVPAMANLGYVTESLEPYGLTDRRLFSWTDRVMCRDLLAVSPAAPTGNYRPSLMTALRHRMRSHFAPVTAVRRMYISRSASRVRRIVNEEEILPMLRKFGFETILTERLSFSEQVRIAGSTTHLIGNHGAGLTNMCWMNPGTTVLEIRRRGDRMNNCYYSLAAALGIHYRYLLCDAIDDRRDTHTADVVVDIRQLERELEALG